MEAKVTQPRPPKPLHPPKPPDPTRPQSLIERLGQPCLSPLLFAAPAELLYSSDALPTAGRRSKRSKRRVRISDGRGGGGGGGAGEERGDQSEGEGDEWTEGEEQAMKPMSQFQCFPQIEY